jgi:hypothetical protein
LPVAFESRKLNPAEARYPTHEKELLAVVHALREWRHYLQGQPFTVVTDNWAVKHFQTQPHLNRRQARWMETLQEYDFTLEHRPGATNVVPDALSRRPDFQSSEERLPESVILGAISTVLYAVSEVRPTVDAVTAAQATAAADEEYQRTLMAVRSGARSDFVLRDDLLYFKGKPGSTPRLYIPAGPFRAQLVAEAHDIAISGHLGRTKTLERLSRAFYWPNMHRVVAEYVRTCPSCQVNKPSNQKPLGLLYSLPVPQRRWDSVSLDLVTGLPRTAAGHDAIVVFVDRLSKMIRIVPTQKTVTAEGTAI